METEKKTAKTARAQLLFICVNYHANDDAIRLMRDLDDLADAHLIKAILVHNGAASANDGSFANMKCQKLSVDVLNIPENAGYFGGARQALRHFIKDYELPDWIAVSNSDIHIADREFLSKLGNEPVGDVLAPQIVSTRTGRCQNPYMRGRPSARRMRTYKTIFGCDRLNQLYHVASACKQKFGKWVAFSAPRDRGESLEPEMIYAPHGSFILFNRSYFERGGNLNHPTFLFGEEIFVAEVARQNGLAIFYRPDLVVYHREHVDTGLMPNRQMRGFIADSSRHLADNYFSHGSM